MKLTGNTILITGGTSGIGLALAKRFLNSGNKVIICSRKQDNLEKVKAECPEINTICCDVSQESDRCALFESVARDYPDLNILINNAGIQQRIDVKHLDWSYWKAEIATNLDAPIHLSGLFVPLLKGKENAHIINVSSGLAFRPPLWAPIYGATKAGLHSFTFVLRQQLLDSGISVTEIIPPAVKTNLGGGKHAFGEDLDAFADSVYKDLGAGKQEIGFAYTVGTEKQTREEMEADALEMAKREAGKH